MAFLLDHLAAAIVGAILLVSLIAIQIRGRQSAVEATVRHQVESHTTQFLHTLQRDLENARTSRQARAALGSYQTDHLGGPTERAFGVHGTPTQTDWIEFVTVGDPTAGFSSPLVAVAYRMEPTGTQTVVNGTARDLYRVVRYEATSAGTWAPRGGSSDTVIGFSGRALDANGQPVVDGRLRDLPGRVEIEVLAATAAPERGWSSPARCGTRSRG